MKQTILIILSLLLLNACGDKDHDNKVELFEYSDHLSCGPFNLFEVKDTLNTLTKYQLESDETKEIINLKRVDQNSVDVNTYKGSSNFHGELSLYNGSNSASYGPDLGSVHIKTSNNKDKYYHCKYAERIEHKTVPIKKCGDYTLNEIEYNNEEDYSNSTYAYTLENKTTDEIIYLKWSNSADVSFFNGISTNLGRVQYILSGWPPMGQETTEEKEKRQNGYVKIHNQLSLDEDDQSISCSKI